MKRNKIVLISSTIILFIIIIELISYIENGIKITKLNNMHKDIEILEDKIALYYLENGNIPIKLNTIIDFKINSINPNDNNIYYEIDLNKLENMNLSYGYGKIGENDKYIINEQSHTVYYYKGIEYNNKKIFSRQVDYMYIDV